MRVGPVSVPSKASAVSMCSKHCLEHRPSIDHEQCSHAMHGRTDGLTKNYSPWESRLTLGIARRGVERFTCDPGEFGQRCALAAQLVHSATNPAAVVELGARGGSEGSTGVLERPAIDIAEIVGGMGAKACQCLFVVCPCHENRCEQEAKWAARIHGWVRRGDPDHYKVYDLCDDCKKHIEESVRQLVGSAGACSCGMTGKSVSDYIGPVIPL